MDGISRLLAGLAIAAGVLLVRVVVAVAVALVGLALAASRLVLLGAVYVAARLGFAARNGVGAVAGRVRY